MQKPSDDLIYDRTLKDVQRVAELNRKISKGEATAEEVREWFSTKGALNHNDLNRIEEWTEFLSNYLKSYGYNAPIKKRAERTYVPQVKPEEVESLLPEGYVQLSYIESTGMQYIDTGFKPNQDTRVVIDVDISSRSTPQAVFGGRHSSQSTTFIVFSLADGSGWQSDYGNEQKLNIAAGTVSNSGRHLVDKNKAKFYVDETLLHTSTASTFQSSYSIYLMQINNAGSTMSSYPFHGKLYSSRIYDNDVLVRDFIPCRNASGDIGLFDAVSQTFYGNAGAGVFLPGEVVASLPEGYERAFYIEATGEQYIDTAYKPNQDTKIIVDFEITELPSSYSAVFSARNTTNGAGAFSLWVNKSVPAFLWQFNTGAGASTANGSPVVVGNRLVAENDSNVMNVGGYVLTEAPATFSTNYSLYLLATNDPDTSNRLACKAKIFSCQIYDNGKLIRNYIPCKNSSGEFGLFDLVEQKFYGNAGTGAFLGTVVCKLPKGYTQVDYIESSGTQYIDTGFIPNQDTRVAVNAIFAVTTSTSYLFGSRLSGSSRNYSFLAYNGTYRSVYNVTETAFASSISYTDRFYIDKNKNVTTVGGSNVIQGTYADFVAPYSMYLFALNNNGTVTGYSKARVYNLQIYDNDVLVRDYVPCINTQGTAGLYDVANNEFYANAGSGTLVAGEEIIIPEGGGGTIIPDAEPIVYSDWHMWDIPYLTEIDRIRDNVNAIQTGFYSLSDWREIAYKNNPNYEDINTLEWDLQSIYQWLNLMMLNFTFSSEIYAGEVW